MALSGNQDLFLDLIQSLDSNQIFRLLLPYDTYKYTLILADLPRRDVDHNSRLLIEVIKVLNEIPKEYRKEIVEEIIKQKANINYHFEDGQVILIMAAIKGLSEIVKLLLDGGADINHQNIYKNTALIVAAYKGHQEIVKLLLDRGADINLQDNDGETALIVAAYYSRQETVKLLLDRGANINHQTNAGCTALIVAACEGYQKLIKLLLKHGADIHLQNNTGKTALIVADEYGHYKIAKLLINSSEPETFTEFAQLSEQLQQEILIRLQDKIDKIKQLPLEEIRRRYPIIRSKAELTPIVLAGAASNLDLIKFLLKRGK